MSITQKKTLIKNACCSYCGQPFSAEQVSDMFPRRCGTCSNVTYFNPLPVAVVLVPIDDGLLLVRRAIPPEIGKLALPGGFVGPGETWQEAGAREVEEETGLHIEPDELTLVDALSALDGSKEGMILLFGLARQRTRADIATFVPNSETSELVVAPEPVELAFPLHNQIAQRFWLHMRARLMGGMYA